jgi:hypothetical protein
MNMNNSILKIYLVFLLIGMLSGNCKESYEPPAIKTDYHFLVVEGIINTGTSAQTTIVLSRSRTLNDTTTFSPETGANVYIESEAGGLYQLQEQANGSYTSSVVNLNSNIKYRLRITTTDQQQYQSDYAASNIAPPIDSLTWKQDKDVTVYVHTHDPANQTHYYQWEYIETWEYDSKLESAWGVKNGLAYPIDPAEQVHTCWIDDHSTDIITGSSIRLSEDVISQQPVAVVPQGSEKISKRYSILVRQYALSQEAYDYWSLIQKNSQQLGTLFDAQPTQLTGNLHNISNANEPVIGYISAGITQEKRLFITKFEVEDWVNTETGPDCYIKSIAQNPNNFLIYDYPDPTYTVYYFVTGGIILAKKVCLDCRTKGGSTVKPFFW